MAAKMSVLELILSSSQYLRSARCRFPLQLVKTVTAGQRNNHIGGLTQGNNQSRDIGYNMPNGGFLFCNWGYFTQLGIADFLPASA